MGLFPGQGWGAVPCPSWSPAHAPQGRRQQHGVAVGGVWQATSCPPCACPGASRCGQSQPCSHVRVLKDVPTPGPVRVPVTTGGRVLGTFVPDALGTQLPVWALRLWGFATSDTDVSPHIMAPETWRRLELVGGMMVLTLNLEGLVPLLPHL